MIMLEFYKTVGGRKFVEHTIPALTDAIIALTKKLDVKDIAEVLENNCKKVQRDIETELEEISLGELAMVKDLGYEGSTQILSYCVAFQKPEHKAGEYDILKSYAAKEEALAYVKRMSKKACYDIGVTFIIKRLDTILHSSDSESIRL